MAAKTKEKFRPVDVFWSNGSNPLHILSLKKTTTRELILCEGDGYERWISNGIQKKEKKLSEADYSKAPYPKKTSKVKSKKTSPIKKKSPTKPTKGEISIHEQATLKDLRPEDKERISNLIKELARLGSEKEVIQKQLEEDRSEFEKKRNELFKAHGALLSERKEIQKQLLKSQTLLAKYQELLLKQQAIKRPKNSAQEKEELFVDNEENLCAKPPPHQPPIASSLNQPLTTHPPLSSSSSSRPFTEKLDIILKEDGPNPSIEKRNRKFPRPPLMSSTKFSDITSAGSTPSRRKVDVVTTEENFIKNLEDSGSKLREEAEIVNFSDLSKKEVGKKSKSSPTRVNKKHSADRLNEKLTEQDTTSLSSIDNKVKEKAERSSSSSVRFNLAAAAPSPEKCQTEMDKKHEEFLEEERRLKEILFEQEKLLEEKKNQLKNQQMIQKARLKYFEKTGTFPSRCSLTDNLNDVIDSLNKDRVYDYNSEDEEKNLKFLKERGIEIKRKPDNQKLLTSDEAATLLNIVGELRECPSTDSSIEEEPDDKELISDIFFIR
ncbi:DgyrCDS4860 [Dimorphilus gyrociliatus]|uniref:DgyrCDS4860 n=1 Tax=Dimorphilus gyrociliatus TaxID=2664684 RepID=A0A7I8VIR4_9ANNE|nr:DgyrCDS4860 [Dimorphilus gyrociliatus]